MVHQATAQLGGGIDQAPLLLALTGVQQQAQRFNRRGAEHHDRGPQQLAFAAAGVEGDDPLGPLLLAIHLQMADDGVTAQGHPAGGQGPGQGDPLGAGARPGPVLGRTMQAKTAGVDQRQPQLPGQGRLQMAFARGEGQGGQVVAVGEGAEAIGLAMDPQQRFQPRVVGVEVCVADRPGGAPAIPFASLEFMVGEPQGDAAPGEAATPHLATPAPQKGGVSRGGVGVQALINKQLGVVFPEARVLGLQPAAATAEKRQPPQAVQGFPPPGPLGAQLGASLEHQHLEARLGQHHGGHAATGTAAHHQRIPGAIKGGVQGHGRGEGRQRDWRAKQKPWYSKERQG